MNSKLPTDVLVRVWEHSDIDKDGYLDSEEFAVAMHLVYKALEKEPVPMLLPQNLIPISKRKARPQGPSLPSASFAAGPGQEPTLSTGKCRKCKFTNILEVNLFAFAYRLFHEDFSSINGAMEILESLCIKAPHRALYYL